MNEQGLNELLKWSVENSDNSRSAAPPADQKQSDPTRGLNAAALAQLLGAPSDADRMKEAMAAIVAPLDQVDLEHKLTAWDNFEQLIENLDNANNMAPLGLWMPLVAQLDDSEADMRRMAAWSISTAVQNNVKCQERLLAVGAIPKLVKLALDDPVQAVRKKAATALSSAVRNYQPAMTELEKNLPDEMASSGRKTDAGDMEAVDEVIQKVRQHAGRA